MSDNADKLWSVRGVPDDVRKLAADAAKAQAIPIGQWVSYAVRQAASDRAGMVGEVVPSDAASDNAPRRVSDALSDRDPMATVVGLAAALNQIGGIKGCGGTAERMRAVLDQHLAGLALGPLPPRRSRPPRIAKLAQPEGRT